MNELQIFNHPDFGQVRTINENGTVLFCGSDVARALGYANSRKAFIDHCKGVTKGLFEVKQSSNQKTGWAGCQTLLTPKGVETFRLLCQRM